MSSDSRTPEMILDRLDDPPWSVPTPPASVATHPPVRWETLQAAWQADLAPWADRVVCVWLPLTRTGTVPWWPHRTAQGTLVVAIQPHGWARRDRHRWIRVWHRWALSHRGAPTDRGLTVLQTVHEPFAWVHCFGVAQDPHCPSGWHWEGRGGYPPLPADTDALNGAPLAATVSHVLRHTPPDQSPVVLADRWAQSPWRRDPQPRLLPALAVGLGAIAGAALGAQGWTLVGVGWFSGVVTLGLLTRAWRHWWATFAWGPQ